MSDNRWFKRAAQVKSAALSKSAIQWNRRNFLKLGLAGMGIAGTAIALRQFQQQSFRLQAAVAVPPIPTGLPTAGNAISPMVTCREFDYGTLKQENGRTIREFQLVANATTLELNSALSFVTWNYNGRVPAPTLRATEGDRLRIIFHNEDGHSHSIHFHGIHPAEMDGVQAVRHGKTTVYEFDAKPYGVHPYHCHVAPIARHISKGLYGALIIDPPGGRPPADELVLIMGGYDINNEQQNAVYAFNGIPNYYRDHPIPIYQNQLVRLYLLNMVEFDPALTFHIHANLFQVYRTGRTLVPTEETDVITMGTAERHILEFSYATPGHYMFHPHQDPVAENGCMGMFEVIAR